MFDEIGANDHLMGGGIPWAKFPDHGDTCEGVICEPAPKTRQAKHFDTGEPLTWDNGDPVLEIVIHVKTEQRDAEIRPDDGTRQLVVKSPAMRSAIRDAVRAAGGRGLEVGDYLKVTYTGDAEPKKRGYKGAKQFTAEYKPRSAADVMAALGAEPVEEPGF